MNALREALWTFLANLLVRRQESQVRKAERKRGTENVVARLETVRLLKVKR